MYVVRCLFPLLMFFVNLTAVDVSTLSLEEKVGQIFMVYFDGENANEHAKRLISEAKIGGFIYYNSSNGLQDPLQVQTLSNDLQTLSLEYGSIPLFISIDQEGGVVQRLTNGFTDFPGNGALGRIGDLSLTRQAAYVIGSELKAVGINMNLSPVVDVNVNPANPVIGIRSFGADPVNVTKLGQAAMRGYRDSGIIPCLKHFPGHGDVILDSHVTQPIVRKSFEELESVEFYPYIQLAKETQMITTAHILFPSLDPDHCATLSKTIIQDLLRKKMGYMGVVLTDSLMMQGVRENELPIEEVFIKAFDAGNDILLIGGRDLQNQVNSKANIDQIITLYRAMIDAVKQGRISEKRLDESVQRILKLKEESKLFSNIFAKPEAISKNLRQENSLSLAKEIAYRAIQVDRKKSVLDIEDKKIMIVAPRMLQKSISLALLPAFSKASLHLYEGDFPTNEAQIEILSKTASYDCVVFCSYNAWKFEKQIELYQSLVKKLPVISIVTRDPEDWAFFSDAHMTIVTYSPSKVSLEVAADWIVNNVEPLQFEGKLARKIGERIWKNESGKRVDLLTFWSEKEPFPSVGIGHFIWPSKKYNGTFEEGKFHEVINYVLTKGGQVPNWLVENRYCPWESRDEFYQSLGSEKMNELRAFLQDSIAYQAMFMSKRVNLAFSQIMDSLSMEKQPSFIRAFFAVANSDMGPYILMDYLNFKGEGIDAKQKYNGYGWGLLQVLEEMTFSSEISVEQAFFEAAKFVLERRVEMSPNPDAENRWIPGWINRLKTYVE